MALELKPPPLNWCSIMVMPWQKTKRSMADTGACHPAAKAAIDGIVDAGILPDDSPQYVREIIFRAPQIGRDALVLIVTGEAT